MREAYDRYSNVSILIHWTVAALVVVNLVIAITLGWVPLVATSCKDAGFFDDGQQRTNGSGSGRTGGAKDPQSGNATPVQAGSSDIGAAGGHQLPVGARLDDPAAGYYAAGLAQPDLRKRNGILRSLACLQSRTRHPLTRTANRTDAIPTEYRRDTDVV